MCCFLDKSNYAPRYATRDIKCYKVMHRSSEDSYKSPIYNFEYKLGELYKTEMSKIHNKALIDKNLNNMYRRPALRGKISSLMFTLKQYKTQYIPSEVYNGFHTYIKYPQSLSTWASEWCCIVECIIPKGSWYYVGETQANSECYVSDQLILSKEVTEL